MDRVINLTNLTIFLELCYLKKFLQRFCKMLLGKRNAKLCWHIVTILISVVFNSFIKIIYWQRRRSGWFCPNFQMNLTSPKTIMLYSLIQLLAASLFNKFSVQWALSILRKRDSTAANCRQQTWSRDRLLLLMILTATDYKQNWSNSLNQ